MFYPTSVFCDGCCLVFPPILRFFTRHLSLDFALGTQERDRERERLREVTQLVVREQLHRAYRKDHRSFHRSPPQRNWHSKSTNTNPPSKTKEQNKTKGKPKCKRKTKSGKRSLFHTAEACIEFQPANICPLKPSLALSLAIGFNAGYRLQSSDIYLYCLVSVETKNPKIKKKMVALVLSG